MPAPSLPQSHARFPLTGILGSAGNVRALRTLASGGAPLSAPQIARTSGLTPRGVRLVLAGLVEQQIVVTHGAGRAVLHALNDAHPLAAALVALFREEQQRWERLLDAVRARLSRHGAAVRAAWLYGSVARGEDTSRSDIDIALLVASPEVADRLREELMPVEDEHGVHFSLAALTPQDLQALADDDPWWSELVRDARVLKGPAPDSAKRQLAKAVA